MNSYEAKLGYIEKGNYVLISKRDVSYDSGRTWQAQKYICFTDEPFLGCRIVNGPSESYGGVVYSGLIKENCSKFDGRQWRSMK